MSETSAEISSMVALEYSGSPFPMSSEAMALREAEDD